MGICGGVERSFHNAEALSVLTYDLDVAVCTIEKANVLFNQLLEKRQKPAEHVGD